MMPEMVPPGPTEMSGSRGTPAPSGTSSLSHIAWLVEPGAVRQAVNGATALSLTSDQGLNAINTIAAKSNDIDASRLWYRPEGGTAMHGTYDCDTGSCHVLQDPLAQDNPPDFGLHDKNGLNLYETAIELQPVMSHRGVSIGQLRATSQSAEVQLYGGWMEDSAFFVRWISYTAHPNYTAGFPHAFGYSHYLRDNLGNPYRDNPQDLALSSPGLKATWSGAAVGIRYGNGVEGNVVHGTSQITITDFANATMDVSLTDLRDLDAGTGLASMTWTGMTISAGAFSAGAADSDNQVRGRFYGSNHTEVTGTFDRNSIIGAFGAIRDSVSQ
ncbi:MAG: transferrin-binding protein-like solute binding protein [Proteobacteria bacterium]|nr:transferrin-binding protein-like solute binding protein [Pseudomonadota bacterium]